MTQEMHLCCVRCAQTYPAALNYLCEKCHGILEVRNSTGCSIAETHVPGHSMWQYSAELGICSPQHIVSLGEGNTPLIMARRLPRLLPEFHGTIWIKNETVNPTGSFKDRLVSAAVSKALELGAKGIVCASSGNAGASSAAYAASAGLPAVIVVPSHTPEEKVIQIKSYGAKLLKVDGDYSRSYAMAISMAKQSGYANTTTTFLNPYGTNALKIVGKELYSQLGNRVPTAVFIPTGSGPLVRGVHQGFEICGNGELPRLVAVQAAGCAPIVRAYQENFAPVRAWENPGTIASGISDPLVGYEYDGDHTLASIRKSKGAAIAVSDEDIRLFMQQLANCEGIMAEPTGASSVAAAINCIKNGMLDDKAEIVCLVTGHGFKDMKVYRDFPACEYEPDTLFGKNGCLNDNLVA